MYVEHALVKLDRESRVLWTFYGKVHHDLEVQPDGEIYVLTRRPVLRPDVHEDLPILEEFVSILTPDGRERKRVSVLDSFLRSEFSSVVDERLLPAGDIFHTNTIEVLDGRLAERVPAFRRGNVLISLRNTNTIAVMDLAAESVVWIAHGAWAGQHHPTVLDNGNLLLFDNLGLGAASRLIELDPETLDIRWTYRAEPPEDFFSVYCGAQQRLAGGNTLITESCNGRAFEVTRDGEIVWEWINPHRAGGDDALIAALYEVLRIPIDRARWLEH